jgi:glutathione peroxidase
MRSLPLCALISATLLGAPLGAKEPAMYDLTVNTLDGKPQPLSAYKGKVVLVVNTASECGFTPQYAGLEKLYEELSPKGLVILGFPSNDFGAQEPGTSQQIATFCKKNYGVTFPMFEKVKVKGEGVAPLYALLGANDPPKWNFHKYLVSKDGRLLKSFPSKVPPDSKELRDAIETALKQ